MNLNSCTRELLSFPILAPDGTWILPSRSDPVAVFTDVAPGQAMRCLTRNLYVRLARGNGLVLDDEWTNMVLPDRGPSGEKDKGFIPFQIIEHMQKTMHQDELDTGVEERARELAMRAEGTMRYVAGEKNARLATIRGDVSDYAIPTFVTRHFLGQQETVTSCSACGKEVIGAFSFLNLLVKVSDLHLTFEQYFLRELTRPRLVEKAFCDTCGWTEAACRPGRLLVAPENLVLFVQVANTKTLKKRPTNIPLVLRVPCVKQDGKGGRYEIYCLSGLTMCDFTPKKGHAFAICRHQILTERAEHDTRRLPDYFIDHWWILNDHVVDQHTYKSWMRSVMCRKPVFPDCMIFTRVSGVRGKDTRTLHFLPSTMPLSQQMIDYASRAVFYRTRTTPVQPVRKRRARLRRNKPESSDSDDAVEKRPDVDVQDLGVQKRLDVDVDIQKRLDVVEQELGAKSMEVVEQDICAEKSMEMDEQQFQFEVEKRLDELDRQYAQELAAKQQEIDEEEDDDDDDYPEFVIVDENDDEADFERVWAECQAEMKVKVDITEAEGGDHEVSSVQM